ncbi:hypothetical protein ACFPIJ_57910 [Dactylosporangium cerinum]|uniref:XRE family transcriptional regulator n=1 Tax=Dactylosporangium cerinum TaxID=1434730 RepID=A0ABV9WGF8_9ACTN
MDEAAIHAAARRFPLLGRPRPACPALPDRIAEVRTLAATAATNDGDTMNTAAQALNKAALIASDCGLPDLAHEWCWHHINTYRTARPLTVLQAGYLLEPVLNLARLQVRADEGSPALHLLNAIYQAATLGAAFVVDDQTISLNGLSGSRDERRQLIRWTWLQLLNEGIRIHAMSGRWDEAVTHANALNGIGLHLMEGRQAAIINELLHHRSEVGRETLRTSTLTEPWEQHVGSCLAVMCATPDTAATAATTMIERFLAHDPLPGYAHFRARWTATVVTLLSPYDKAAAAATLRRAADEVLASPDGYAARELLGACAATRIDEARHNALTTILTSTNLSSGMPADSRQTLNAAVQQAATALRKIVQ